MKVKIKARVVKYTEEEVEMNLPEKPFFWFQFGMRYSWAAFPIWTTWNVANKGIPEEIYQYRVVRLDDTRMEIETVNVSSLAELYRNYGKMKQTSVGMYFANYLMNPPEPREVRTQQQFMDDFKRLTDNVENPLAGIFH